MRKNKQGEKTVLGFLFLAGFLSLGLVTSGWTQGADGESLVVDRAVEAKQATEAEGSLAPSPEEELLAEPEGVAVAEDPSEETEAPEAGEGKTEEESPAEGAAVDEVSKEEMNITLPVGGEAVPYTDIELEAGATKDD
ncbi:MAG TPA: hypothetical protein PLD92_05695, partial [Candidatus Omnitrophota bacterium]|nr:hypothetical protein [Candidatus Omnitrophota bacterium]